MIAANGLPAGCKYFACSLTRPVGLRSTCTVEPFAREEILSSMPVQGTWMSMARRVTTRPAQMARQHLC